MQAPATLTNESGAAGARCAPAQRRHVRSCVGWFGAARIIIVVVVGVVVVVVSLLLVFWL